MAVKLQRVRQCNIGTDIRLNKWNRLENPGQTRLRIVTCYEAKRPLQFSGKERSFQQIVQEGLNIHMGENEL